MNRQVCKYSIIRFQPFVETEEFANIGIVLFIPATQQLSFKLLNAREHGRISQFFEPLNRDIYTHSLAIIRAELERIQGVCSEPTANNFDFFAELIRTREDIIQYSSSRVLFSSDIETTLNQLFVDYVHRSFARKEAYEELMQKKLQLLLKRSGLEREFIKRKIGDENKYTVSLPFVNQQENAAIKPIHFRHISPNKLIEHGLLWMTKVQQLHKYGFIQAENVLFAYKEPEEKQGNLFSAFVDIKEQIESIGIMTSDIDDTEQIMRFVERV
ncbi:MAG: DUF3037 domain-containing protein [Methyloprofundus sp.]|nr:DUF3037 domain-containing protein [Methyloprofundus sp.]